MISPETPTNQALPFPSQYPNTIGNWHTQPRIEVLPLQYMIKLVTGDWSYDGHEKTEECFIMSTHTAKNIELAYRSFFKEHNLDEPCQDYEEQFLNEVLYNKLQELEIQIDDITTSEYPIVHPSDFSTLYMRIANYQLPTLRWIYRTPEQETLNIGGYGLFT